MRYEYIVEGSVTEAVQTQLPEMSSTGYPTGGTALYGPVRDEADVVTMFERISSLGLRVVETRRLPD